MENIKLNVSLSAYETNEKVWSGLEGTVGTEEFKATFVETVRTALEKRGLPVSYVGIDEPKSPEAQVDGALDLLRNAHYAEISAICDEIEEKVKAGEISDSDDLQTWVHETLDGHHDVMYTRAAQIVCLVSSNDGAFADSFGSEGLVKDGSLNWSGMAYCAMEQDVWDELDSRDLDPNDVEDWYADESEESDGE